MMEKSLEYKIQKDKAIYTQLKEFSKACSTSYDNTGFLQNIIDRNNNSKQFIFNDHIKALIYSQLSNQTRWVNIQRHLDEIDDLFFQYDRGQILSKPFTYFYDGIRKLKCGNMLSYKQMEALAYNIGVLEEIEKDFGGVDSFFQKFPAGSIVKALTSGKYKLKYIGPALAWEYLRNVGIDGTKPDLHMKRILGSGRLGYSTLLNATDQDVINAVTRISENNGGVLYAEIDTLLWNFCASGFGAICTATPDCSKCPIEQYCNQNKKGELKMLTVNKPSYNDPAMKSLRDELAVN